MAAIKCMPVEAIKNVLLEKWYKCAWRRRRTKGKNIRDLYFHHRRFD